MPPHKITPLCQCHDHQASLRSAIIRSFPEVLSISHCRIRKTGDNAGGKKSEVTVNEYSPVWKIVSWNPGSYRNEITTWQRGTQGTVDCVATSPTVSALSCSSQDEWFLCTHAHIRYINMSSAWTIVRWIPVILTSANTHKSETARSYKRHLLRKNKAPYLFK